jgi:hypothetical protein
MGSGDNRGAPPGIHSPAGIPASASSCRLISRVRKSRKAWCRGEVLRRAGQRALMGAMRVGRQSGSTRVSVPERRLSLPIQTGSMVKPTALPAASRRKIASLLSSRGRTATDWRKSPLVNSQFRRSWRCAPSQMCRVSGVGMGSGRGLGGVVHAFHSFSSAPWELD